MRHLLGLEELCAGDITAILDDAKRFKDLHHKQPGHDSLAGKTVVMLFFEPSTRTSSSFATAARRLGAELISVTGNASSVVKGETLADTARNVLAMAGDVVVVRHRYSGTPRALARALRVPIVNAGDGMHEHPTQGLLDIFTLREKLGRIEGLHVGIVGDIAHSRVARSNIHGLLKLGARVTLVGPPTLIPPQIEKLGVSVSNSLDETLPALDAVNMLRIQNERLAGALIPSQQEYSDRYQLNARRLDLLPYHAIVMHPGPMNRGVEISSDVADGPRSVILQQVTNGVFVRMAVLQRAVND